MVIITMEFSVKFLAVILTSFLPGILSQQSTSVTTVHAISKFPAIPFLITFGPPSSTSGVILKYRLAIFEGSSCRGLYTATCSNCGKGSVGALYPGWDISKCPLPLNIARYSSTTKFITLKITTSNFPARTSYRIIIEPGNFAGWGIPYDQKFVTSAYKSSAIRSFVIAPYTKGPMMHLNFSFISPLKQNGIVAQYVVLIGNPCVMAIILNCANCFVPNLGILGEKDLSLCSLSVIGNFDKRDSPIMVSLQVKLLRPLQKYAVTISPVNMYGWGEILSSNFLTPSFETDNSNDVLMNVGFIIGCVLGALIIIIIALVSSMLWKRRKCCCQKPDETFSVLVKCGDGKAFMVLLHTYEKVEILRNKISHKLGTDPSTLGLTCNGLVLKNGKNMTQLKVKEGDVVYLEHQYVRSSSVELIENSDSSVSTQPKHCVCCRPIINELPDSTSELRKSSTSTKTTQPSRSSKKVSFAIQRPFELTVQLRDESATDIFVMNTDTIETVRRKVSINVGLHPNDIELKIDDQVLDDLFTIDDLEINEDTVVMAEKKPIMVDVVYEDVSTPVKLIPGESLLKLRDTIALTFDIAKTAFSVTVNGTLLDNIKEDDIRCLENVGIKSECIILVGLLP